MRDKTRMARVGRVGSVGVADMPTRERAGIQARERNEGRAAAGTLATAPRGRAWQRCARSAWMRGAEAGAWGGRPPRRAPVKQGESGARGKFQFGRRTPRSPAGRSRQPWPHAFADSALLRPRAAHSTCAHATRRRILFMVALATPYLIAKTDAAAVDARISRTFASSSRAPTWSVPRMTGGLRRPPPRRAVTATRRRRAWRPFSTASAMLSL